MLREQRGNINSIEVLSHLYLLHEMSRNTTFNILILLGLLL